MNTDFFDKPLEYCQSLIDEADRYYDVHKEAIRKGRNHYQLISDHLMARQGIPGRYANYFPELHPAVFSRAAQMLDAFRQGDPVIKLSAQGDYGEIPEVVQGVNRLEKWIDMCFKEGKILQEIFQALLSAELFPYAVLYAYWDDRWGSQPYLTQEGKLSTQQVITYSGFKIVSVPPENYRGDFFARYQDDMRFHARIKDVSEGYIRMQAKRGYYPYFDESRIKEASKSNWPLKRSKERIVDDYNRPDDYNVELIELKHLVYDEENDAEIWQQTIFAGSLLLDTKPYPYPDINPPFKILTAKILPHEVTGIPTTKLGAGSQNIVNELWNQRIEANEQSIWSPIIFDGDITSNPTTEPQTLWRVENPESFRPLIKPNLSGDLVADMRFVEERNQALLGSYDTIQPVTSKSKQTLGEYEGKQRNSNVIIAPTLMAHTDAVIDLVQAGIAMARERMPDNIELQLFGNNPILNSLQLSDLAMNLIIDAPKVKSIALDSIESQKWMFLYDKMIANPIVMSSLENIYELTFRFLEANDVMGIEKMIGRRENYANQQINPMMPIGGANVGVQ